eukprot:symbB.v1.2.016080.t1/scaffold1216.1/size131131/6
MVLQEKIAVSDVKFAEEEEEKNFHLIVKETFLEYVPDREEEANPPMIHTKSEPPKQGCTAANIHWKNLGKKKGEYFRLQREGLKLIVKLFQKQIFCCQPENFEGKAPKSIGSRLHGSGLCKPCAWFWKPTGCLNGYECRHCHSCTSGEFNRRKRERRRLFRQKGAQVHAGEFSPISPSSFISLSAPQSPRTEPAETRQELPSPHGEGFQRAVTWPAPTAPSPTATSSCSTQAGVPVTTRPVMIIAVPVAVPVAVSAMVFRTNQ